MAEPYKRQVPEEASRFHPRWSAPPRWQRRGSIRLILAVVVVAALVSNRPVQTQANSPPPNWPQVGYDAGHSGFNPTETALNTSNVPKLKLAWEQKVSYAKGKSINSSTNMVMANGAIYLGINNILYAISTAGCGSGIVTCPAHVLWRATGLGVMVLDVAVLGQSVYATVQAVASPQPGSAGFLYAFKSTGCGTSVCKPTWTAKPNVGGAPSGAVEDSGGLAVTSTTVYLSGNDGVLYAYSSAGCPHSPCQPAWTSANLGSIFGAPAVSGDVFVGSQSSGFNTLDAFKPGGCGTPTCQPQWIVGLNSPTTSPVGAGGKVYVAEYSTNSNSNDVAVIANTCASTFCNVLWRTKAIVPFINGRAVAGGSLFLTNAGEGLAVYPTTGCANPCSPRWTSSGFDGRLVLANGVVYGTYTAFGGKAELNANSTRCAAQTCAQIWNGPLIAYNSGLNFYSDLIVGGGTLYGYFNDSGATPGMLHLQAFR